MSGTGTEMLACEIKHRDEESRLWHRFAKSTACPYTLYHRLCQKRELCVSDSAVCPRLAIGTCDTAQGGCKVPSRPMGHGYRRHVVSDP
eukprot:2370069-Rhodomonas_salina.1